MASELRVDKIIPSSGTSIGIGTASGTIDILGNSQINTTGVITATSFVASGTITGEHHGSGANLTNIPAANLTGTIADARFPATLPAASAANLTNVPAANITGTLPAISGANLTGIGGWTHFNNVSFGSGGSYTFTGIPTDTTALRIGFTDLSSNTGSSGSESYAAFRLGTASGFPDTNYDTISSYLEDSYQQVETWSSRAILYPSNYGRSQHVFSGQIECWKLGNTTRWFIKSQLSRGAAAGHQTHFFMQSSIDIGGAITQARIFLNTGSFDGGSGAISYYQG